MTTTTLILTDDNQSGDDAAFTAATRSEALRALYQELVRRNDGDCRTHIEAGFVYDYGRSCNVDMRLDAEDFWSLMVDAMIADTQDYQDADA